MKKKYSCSVCKNLCDNENGWVCVAEDCYKGSEFKADCSMCMWYCEIFGCQREVCLYDNGEESGK